MRQATFERKGYARQEPGFCHCTSCGARVSTNARARWQHERSAEHLQRALPFPVPTPRAVPFASAEALAEDQARAEIERGRP